MSYKMAVEILSKAYKLGDFDVIDSIRRMVYNEFGNDIADNIDSAAYLRSKDPLILL